jgi:sterol desaturase/sphingolipid hydroxylase (fatty acid hydroxylase superfamily)
LETTPGSEATLRLGIFFGAFAVLALWEGLAPRREGGVAARPRRVANLSLVALNTALARIALPAGAVGVALIGESRGLGLLRNVEVPGVLALVVGVVVLDLAIYFQHRLFHALPLLWRFHRIHHADRAFDLTTGFRFHPIEIAISLAIKVAVLLAFGVSAGAVLVFEVLLSTTALFNHANVAMPRTLDAWLRWIVVTPDMHRVHHSVVVRETNSNFGFNLPWWDRLFGTYRAQPEAGHSGVTIGLPTLQAERPHELRWALAAPFWRGQSESPLRDDSR